jgi:hypothetical protein
MFLLYAACTNQLFNSNHVTVIEKWDALGFKSASEFSVSQF